MSNNNRKGQHDKIKDCYEYYKQYGKIPEHLMKGVAVTKRVMWPNDEDDERAVIPEARCCQRHAAERNRLLSANNKPKCPGTLDRLSRRMAPCSEARTLREIALGRRLPPPSQPKVKVIYGVNSGTHKR